MEPGGWDVDDLVDPEVEFDDDEADYLEFGEYGG